MTIRQLILGVGLWAATISAQAHSGLEVRFVEPEHFKDVSLSGAGTDKVRSYVLKELEKHLHRLADVRLAHGHRLDITIYDVDMAGEFEPWRSPMLTNTRVVRGIYRPSIKLRYRWSDSHGRVIAENDTTVSDLNFLQFTTLY